MVQVVIVLVLGAIGLWAFWSLLRLLQGLSKPRPVADPKTDQQDIEPVEPEGEIANDGLVYMFAGKFVKPATRRALGSIPRDRAFDLASDTELDPRDFAQEIVYTTLIQLYENGCIKFRLVPRDASFMPPFPHKAWELRVRQLQSFPSSPICDSLNIAFEMIYKRRAKKAETASKDGIPEDDLWVSLDDLLENALKAMRQEMSFWERGCIYSDLRNYVGIGLTAQRYLVAPRQDTWLDRIRRKPPTPNPVAMESQNLEAEAEALLKRINAFRARFGSAAACEDPDWPAGDVDPGLLQPQCPLEDLPLDDCLRVSIYETLIAIRQLEPSGEAGI